MTEQLIHIKNMVCDRCIMAVETALKDNGLQAAAVTLGEVRLSKAPTAAQLGSFRKAIESIGFEWIEDQSAVLISQARQAAQDYARTTDPRIQRQKFSAYLQGRLPKDYATVSSLFSSKEGITLEQYVIRHKIEYVKELLVYDQYTLSEIADRLGYSSVQHLSNQFRKVTGLTPTHFRKLGATRRKPLDQVG